MLSGVAQNPIQRVVISFGGYRLRVAGFLTGACRIGAFRNGVFLAGPLPGGFFAGAFFVAGMAVVSLAEI